MLPFCAKVESKRSRGCGRGKELEKNIVRKLIDFVLGKERK
jgi:hypothetical protein